MKVVGIQIKSNVAILVVLEKDDNGIIKQTNESIKFEIPNSEDYKHVQQFRAQINTAFDNIRPAKIGIIARNAKAKGKLAPSPISFKLEGIIQLYEKQETKFVWPQTLLAYYKKNRPQVANNVYQQDAYNLAFYLFNE